MTTSESIKLAVMGLELSNIGKKILMIDGKTEVDNSVILTTAMELTSVCNALAELLNECSNEERA